jgi:hypothetical protein
MYLAFVTAENCLLLSLYQRINSVMYHIFDEEEMARKLLDTTSMYVMKVTPKATCSSSFDQP